MRIPRPVDIQKNAKILPKLSPCARRPGTREIGCTRAQKPKLKPFLTEWLICMRQAVTFAVPGQRPKVFGM